MTYVYIDNQSRKYWQHGAYTIISSGRVKPITYTIRQVPNLYFSRLADAKAECDRRVESGIPPVNLKDLQDMYAEHGGGWNNVDVHAKIAEIRGEE